MISKTEILKKITEHKKSLEDKFGVIEIAIFGSYARESATENSDIDVMVQLREPLGWSFFDLTYYLEDLLGKKVDLLTDEVKTQRFWKYIKNDIIYV